MNPTFNTLAVVISRHNQQEKNILVCLLTPNLGKIFAIATGAKSIRSRRLSSLEPGSIIQVQLSSKNKYYWINEIQTTSSFMLLPKNLTQLNLLFCVLEIVKNAIPENEPSPTIFTNIENIIFSLNNNRLQSFLSYQIQLLTLLGFGMPQNLQENFKNKKYHLVQEQLLNQFEQILEKPLFSRKLLQVKI